MAANGAQYGVATVHYYWIGAIPAMVFLGIVMMPFYYRSKVRSVPEFLRLRFGNYTHVLNASVFAVASVLIAGVNLYALAIVLNALLGWPLFSASSSPPRSCWSTSASAGSASAIYGEVLQFFVILAGLIPLAVVAVRSVGGFGELTRRVEASTLGEGGLHAWQGTGVGDVTNPIGANWIGIVLGLGFVLSFGYWTTNFAEIQRALSAKDRVGVAAHAPHRRVPEAVHPGRHDHPRPRRAHRHPELRQLRLRRPRVQRRDPRAHRPAPARGRARRRDHRAVRVVHGRGGRQRLEPQHGGDLRPHPALPREGPQRRLLPQRGPAR